MVATPRPCTTDAEREPWTKLRSNERCENCGHRGYCMYNTARIYCMWPDLGRPALHEGKDKAGMPYAVYPRTGTAPPTPIRTTRPDERPDWERPDTLACEYLYSELARRCADNPPPAEALAADAARFGPHADAVRTISDHFYIADPAGLLAWLAAEGRTQDARNAGILTRQGELSPALLARKVYPWRDERGRVKDLRGRAYDGTEPKVRSLAGGREERGADGVWYQHRQLAGCAGHIRVAGGAEKADALIVAGLPAVGTNEGQASDAMLAALRAAGVVLATLHVDAEDPKPDRPLSEGRRLALALAERLEAAGICVRIAEPAREPGTPKLDADTLLRDGGPEALLAVDRAALPLAVWRKRVGAEPEATPPALVAELRAQLHVVRAERDQAHEWNRLTLATLRAGQGTTPKMKTVGRAGLGLVLEWDIRRHQGCATIDPETGERWVEVNLSAAGENVGLGDDAAGAALALLCKEGIARKRSKWLPVENPEPGQYPCRKQLLVHFPQGTKEAALAAIAALRPEKSEAVNGWGGKRTPRCAQHPDAGTVTHTTVACAECGTVLEQEEVRHDAAGNRVEDGGEVQPQDAGYRLTSSEERLDPPELTTDLQPHLAVEPLPPLDLAAHRPRCRNYRGADKGCQQRTDPGVWYCPACEVGGYVNPPPSPPGAGRGSDACAVGG